MSAQTDQASAADDRRYHSYTTHRIPWYVRLMWVVFWVALVWYLVKFAIPAAKTYF
ncbi:MAG: hypothetical protein IT449_06430 [Phycisphaerales bacterium]|nr:hypothetical protein [Phycisphaerales bacterium]